MEEQIHPNFFLSWLSSGYYKYCGMQEGVVNIFDLLFNGVDDALKKDLYIF